MVLSPLGTTRYNCIIKAEDLNQSSNPLIFLIALHVHTIALKWWCCYQYRAVDADALSRIGND